MELHLGKMTNQELADWFHIKYNTYTNHSINYLKILEDYCVFKRVRGGIEVSEILISEYNKNMRCKIDSLFLAETRGNIQKHDGLQSIAGMVRKYKNDPIFQGMSPNGAYYQLCKSRNLLYGERSKDKMTSEKGIAGQRTKTWAIKLGDYNIYRHLTLEEEALLKQLEENAYSTKDNKKSKFYQLHHQLINDEIELNEYKTIVNEQGYDFYALVLEQFNLKTGETLVHIDKYEEELHFIDDDKNGYLYLQLLEAQNAKKTVDKE